MRAAPHPTLEDSERAFFGKLHKAKLAIIREAEGRTCGECRHASLSTSGVGFCDKYLNFEGASLQIHTARAHACRLGFAPAHS